jgi:hypothetical protein
VESPWETSQPYYPTWPPLLAKTFRHDNQWSSNGPFPLIDPGRLGNLRPSQPFIPCAHLSSAKEQSKICHQASLCKLLRLLHGDLTKSPAPAIRPGEHSANPGYCDQTFARRNRMLRQSGARHGDPIFRDEHMLCFGLNCPFGLFLRSRHRDWNLRTSPGNGSPSQPWYKHRFQKAVATVPSAQIPTQASTQECLALHVFSGTCRCLAVPEPAVSC